MLNAAKFNSVGRSQYRNAVASGRCCDLRPMNEVRPDATALRY